MAKVRLHDDHEDMYVEYKCPGCQLRHVIPTKGPNAWNWNGDVNKPSLSPSVLATRRTGDAVSCRCHHYVTNGQIQFLGDCTHKSAGKTVDMMEFDDRGNYGEE